MPKLIDYPRTSYTGAWEVAEVVDDTGGKCALETCARKLNRKVSGSFKAIVGSAVKFGLLTSKREILTTTTLFRRIKHAYDKQEELLFHREAFLTPPLFAQICRKFRSRELPVAMLDVLLIREFDVEEINAQGVAKAFVDGARMVAVLDEHNIVADIDQLAARQPTRRELASPLPADNVFRQAPSPAALAATNATPPIPATNAQETAEPATERAADTPPRPAIITTASGVTLPASRPAPATTTDAIATLFGLGSNSAAGNVTSSPKAGDDASDPETTAASRLPAPAPPQAVPRLPGTPPPASEAGGLFHLQLTGPGINTELEVWDVDDLNLVRALLDKIERQLKRIV